MKNEKSLLGLILALCILIIGYLYLRLQTTPVKVYEAPKTQTVNQKVINSIPVYKE